MCPEPQVDKASAPIILIKESGIQWLTHKEECGRIQVVFSARNKNRLTEGSEVF